MPQKIRELKQMLRRAGFSERPGKGSHTNWTHRLYLGKITLSGNDGNDAKPYQEQKIASALAQVRRREENG